MGVWDEMLVPQVGSGRKGLRAGGGGTSSTALTMCPYSWIGIMVRVSEKQGNRGIN
jgi:hypothetical protein